MSSVLGIGRNWQALCEFTANLSRYRALVREMTRRDLFEPYAGQMFGAAWTFLHPLVLMGVYVFVFNVVFKVKVGGTVDLPRDYTTYLLSGLIPWLGIVAGMSKGASVLLMHANLVKQVVFPIEILPVKSTIAAMVPQGFSLGVLVAYQLLAHGAPPITYVMLPLAIAIQFALMLGVAFVFSIISCFVRDMKELVQVMAVVGIYLLPVCYLPAWVPTLFKPLLYANPFSYIIWVYQDILYFGRIEHPLAWFVSGAMAVMLLVFGYRLFRSQKPHIASLL
ncbi:MAG: ABC transporter permease [Rhodococcus sp.]|nr:ABC transporter permease [Rhodococcus sp. (in: high G+C Gram-positive bacteria)]